jgi:ankyrin repeat protein
MKQFIYYTTLITSCLFLVECSCRKNYTGISYPRARSHNKGQSQAASRALTYLEQPQDIEKLDKLINQTNPLNTIKQLLQEKKIDITQIDNQGRTSLHYALRKRNIPLFNLFLDHLKEHHPEKLEELLNHTSTTDDTPFLCAIENIIFLPPDLEAPEAEQRFHHPTNERLATIKKLNELGAKPTEEDLIKAIEKSLKQGDEELFRYLITLPNAPPADCLLHIVSQHQRPHYIKYLQEQFGNTTLAENLTLTNEDGNNALHIAALSNNDQSVKTLQPLLQLLPEEKILNTLNSYNKTGKTPLHLAIEQGSFQNVKTLIDAGANPNLATSNGITPLEMAKVETEKLLSAGTENNSIRAIYQILKKIVDSKNF